MPWESACSLYSSVDKFITSCNVEERVVGSGDRSLSDGFPAWLCSPGFAVVKQNTKDTCLEYFVQKKIKESTVLIEAMLFVDDAVQTTHTEQTAQACRNSNWINKANVMDQKVTEHPFTTWGLKSRVTVIISDLSSLSTYRLPGNWQKHRQSCCSDSQQEQESIGKEFTLCTKIKVFQACILRAILRLAGRVEYHAIHSGLCVCKFEMSDSEVL